MTAEVLSLQQKIEKPQKGKFWIVGNIYFYIVGVNLGLFIIAGILSQLINIKELIDKDNFLLQVLIVLISIVVAFFSSVFAIKWGVESVFKKTTISLHEFLVIVLWVAIIPIILEILASVWVVYINLGNLSRVVPYLIPKLVSGLILSIISGVFYGAMTYYWLKRLSKEKKEVVKREA